MAEVSRVERAAMQGEPMPTGLTWREVTEYIALRALYWGFKNRVFSRDDASAMKKQLMAALDGAEGAYQFQRKCWDNAARRYKETERAISAYRLERTLEHADALVAAFDGLRFNLADAQRRGEGTPPYEADNDAPDGDEICRAALE